MQYRGPLISKEPRAVDLQDLLTDTVCAFCAQGLRRARQREQRVCDPIGSMAKNVAFRDKVPGDTAYAHGFDALDVGSGRLGAFRGVALAENCRYGTGADQGVIEDGPAGVLVDALNMLSDAQAETLVGLGHEVGDVDADSVGGNESFRDPVDEQVEAE